MTVNKSTLTVTIVLIVALGLTSGYAYHLNTQLLLLEQRVEVLESQSSQVTFNSLINNNSDSLQKRLLDLSTEVKAIREDLETIPEDTLDGIGVAELYSMVKDSVVSIHTTIQLRRFLTEAQGSGFIYDSSGIVITNNHVVDGAASIEVVFIDGSSSTASVVGSDLYSDLAVLRLEEPPIELKPLPLGDSSSLRVGDPIIVIGNPFGLSGSLTTGVVSQIGRTLSATGGYTIPNVIQIDAAINPGNSGGPLLNIRGEVIGITTAIQSTTGTFSGVGFAIPSDTIKRETPSIIEKGGYGHPWLGVSGVEMTSEIAELMKVDTTKGWLITEVVKGGPADQAGLRGGTQKAQIGETTIPIGGDIILKLDDHPIRDGEDLSSYLEERTKPDQTIKVTIERNRAIRELFVAIGVRPPSR